VGYNVDSFGHPATLPDLLAEMGYHGYVFHRPNQRQVPLPAQTFRWQGSGGAEIIGFRIAPVYVTRANELQGQIDISLRAADPELGHTMMFYGLGNHGGGPTKATIEWLLEHRNAIEGVELRFSTVDEFYAAAEAKRETLPVVDYELQKTFPGCYSVMHSVKQIQHRGERQLEQAEELAAAFCPDEVRKRESMERIDAAWRDLAFTQFHDILAGTSIPSAYVSTRHMQGRAGIVGEEEIVRITRRFARATLPKENTQRLVILNGGAHAFNGHIECEPFIDFDDWDGRCFADEHGEPVPFQLITSEPNTGPMVHRVVLPVSVTPRGSRVLQLREGGEPDTPLTIPVPVQIEGRRLATGDLTAEVSPQGIRSLCWKGTELLGEHGLSLQLREDHGDTWGFHQTAFEENIAASLADLDWVVEDEGPLRARLFADQVFGDSTMRLAVTLYSGQPEFHLHLQVVFNERYKMLQMPIQLAAPPIGWTSGLAGGHVAREPGSDEMPFCAWDSVQSPGASLSLHTPDTYSSRLLDKTWQFSLLRSPLTAWFGEPGLKPAFSRRHTDQGWHEFHFILRVADALDPAQCELTSAQQAKPPVVFDHYEGMNRPAWGNAPPRRLWTPDIPHARSLGHMKHLDAMAGEKGSWGESPE
jgi:alpha-mannosidase